METTMTRFFAIFSLALVLTGFVAQSASARPDIDNGYGRGSTTDVGG
jgi:hypothetical protein